MKKERRKVNLSNLDYKDKIIDDDDDEDCGDNDYDYGWDEHFRIELNSVCVSKTLSWV